MRDAGYEPQEPYSGAQARWKCIHIQCGEVVYPQLGNIKSGWGGCARKCTGKEKHSHEDATALMRSAGFEPLEPYPGRSKPWRCVHDTCGREVTPRYSSIVRGSGCSICSGNQIDPEQRVSLMRSRGLEPLEPYKNAHAPWKSIHIECGMEVSPTANSIIPGADAPRRHILHPTLYSVAGPA